MDTETHRRSPPGPEILLRPLAGGRIAPEAPKRADAAEAALFAGQSRILEMIAGGTPLAETLRAIIDLVEDGASDMLASILLLDDDGMHLRHGAAGRLPEAYCRAVDGLHIGPQVGSCGTAVYRRAPVIVYDIQADPLWADFRTIAATYGLRACWSTPIFDPLRRVLGTFAIYFREPGYPAERHIRLTEMATHAASVAIVRMHDERERARLLREMGERVKELTLLHRASRLLQQPRPLDGALLAELAALLPPSWQHPEACAARIAYGGLEAKTRGWRATPWTMSAAFRTGDGHGTIEVAYLEERPAADGPFLAEERRVIDSLADMLAAHFDRTRLQRELDEREGMFRSILEGMTVGFVAMDRDYRFVYVNGRAQQILGRDARSVLGKTYREAFPEAADSAFELAYRKAMDERVSVQNEGYFEPWERWFEQRVDPTPGGISVYFQDITERKRNEARIEYLASHDELTGLPNRSLIRDRITQAIAHARRAQRQIAVLYVDLDGFKAVNDGFGHALGDALLKAAGERLAKAMRDGDTVARQGGDEFLILLADLGKPADAHFVTQRILDAFARPFVLEGREVRLGASVGASLYPHDGQSADALIGNADAAMYRAKDGGRNACQFFVAGAPPST